MGQSQTENKEVTRFDLNQELDQTDKFQEHIINYQVDAPILVPSAVIIIGIMVAYFAHDSTQTIIWVSWLTTFIIVEVLRFCYLAYVHRSTQFSITDKLDRCIRVALADGFLVASAFLFFPSLTFPERSTVTLIFLGLISGAVITTNGYKKILLPYATPIIGAMALCWALVPMPELGTHAQIGITSLILIFFTTQMVMSKRYLVAVQESFDVREEHTELNQRLNRELVSSINKEEQLTELNQKLNNALSDAVKASKSKTRFLALASHDLRQPIHTLSLFSAALSLRSLDSKSSAIANRIETAVDNLAAQMDSLLDISKLDAGLVFPNMVNVDLVVILERICIEHKNLAESVDLKFDFKSSVSSAATSTDPELFERVIRNIIDNAIKHTDEGKVEVRLERVDEIWCVEISDTGHGISESDQASIYEEFFQVSNPERDRTKGLGLGLAIVKRLSELLRISIKVESEVNHGTTFKICVPALEVDSFHEPVTVDIPSIEGLTIICVDDEIAIREALEDLLSAMGCSVFTCRGTQETVALVKHIIPDALLVDFRLVGEDSGLKTIAAARAIHPNLPAILVTGDTAPERLMQANQANVPMLHKPVSADRLQKIIGEITKE